MVLRISYLLWFNLIATWFGVSGEVLSGSSTVTITEVRLASRASQHSANNRARRNRSIRLLEVQAKAVSR